MLEWDRNTYRIPLKTHRIWVTNPNEPREMLDVLTDTFLQDKISDTNAVFDAAAQAEGNNASYTHYFWVNNKTVLPHTVAAMEAKGFVVKELREL